MKSVNKNFNYLDDLRLLDGKHGKNTFFNSKLILSRNKKKQSPPTPQKNTKKTPHPNRKNLHFTTPPPLFSVVFWASPRRLRGPSAYSRCHTRAFPTSGYKIQQGSERRTPPWRENRKSGGFCMAGPTRREWGSLNLYIGILGMKLPSFPTKGQLVLWVEVFFLDGMRPKN